MGVIGTALTRRRLFEFAMGSAALAAAGCSGDPAPTHVAQREVRTTAGLVRGQIENGIAVFRGIPYAKAPVGLLRFQAPEPYPQWKGVRDAFQFGPQPPQNQPAGEVLEPMGPGDEWLTVNVWSPNTRGHGLPVMVWIYGGAYIHGSSSMPIYNGANLASQGAVVVTLNYRVGVEGFVQIDGAPANRGVLDQISALTWVRDNIAAFGGDPGQVTVFGESAGAGSVVMLLAAPSASGLFHRAAAESVPGVFQTPELAADVSLLIAGALGKLPTVDALGGVAPQALVDVEFGLVRTLATYQRRWGLAQVVSTTPVLPVIDGIVLPETPWQALSRGVSKDIPLLVGTNRDEYALMMPTVGGVRKITPAQAQEALHTLPPIPDGPEAYRAAYPRMSDGMLYQTVCSDYLFRMPSLHTAQAHVAGGGTAYLYEFRYDATPVGAAHSVELPLIFGTAGTSGARFYGSPPSAGALRLGKQMQADWLSFAATGDAGWPAYAAYSQSTRLYDGRSVSVGPFPEQASERIWASASFDPLPLPRV